VFGHADRRQENGHQNGGNGNAAATLSLAGNEAYRLLHANLSWLQATQQLKTIVVASALPGEGKTTVAANLALTFALEGRRTLLVDADLRRPRVHKTFRVARVPGLAQVLAGYVDLPAAICTTFVDGLYVLPSGHAAPSPVPLVRAAPMRDLLARCAESFDVVIVDTPPIFVAADAAIIGPVADGVLLVVRAGSTESEAAQQAFHQVSGVGARVIGAVLNDPNGEAGDYGEQYASYSYADVYAGSVEAAR
jgi:capsular exopolysaccharide synthesis family protein